MNLNNLSSPSEQLNLLKQLLDSFEFPDNTTHRFMYQDYVIPEIINYIYERPDSGKILKSVTLKPVDFGIEKVLSILAESLVRMWNNHKSNSTVMNVLAPSAMEDYTYLGYTFFADKLCLSGEVSLYIKEENTGDITPPIPVLTAMS